MATQAPALEPSAATPEQASRARRALLAGALLLAAGLVVVGIGASDPGTAVTLAGLLVTIYGVHAFGRLGPEELALVAEEEPNAAPRRGRQPGGGAEREPGTELTRAARAARRGRRKPAG